MKKVFLLLTIVTTLLISTNSEAKGKRKKSRKAKSYSSSSSSRKDVGRSKYSNITYITGKRGGCYYINEFGNKVYVDHSNCR